MLKSFFDQNYLNEIKYEILVVDNNSADETKLVVADYLSNPACRYIFEPKQGLSSARNRGVSESKGEIIAFLDDDVIVDSCWLRSLEECFLETNADVVGGRAYLIIENEPPEWLGPAFRSYLSEVELGDKRQLRPHGDGLYGLNLSFRRSVLNEVGVFDEKLGRSGSQLIGAEEMVLLQRISILKKKIVYEPKAIVGHIIGADRLEWDYFSKLAIASGKTKVLKEWKSGISRQIFRVLKSVIDYLAILGKLVGVNIYKSNSYEKKLAKWSALEQKSHLIHRWKTLLNLIA